MFPMSQALAEYVGVTFSKLGAEAGAFFRQAGRLASDNFIFVMIALTALALVLMMISGSRR